MFDLNIFNEDVASITGYYNNITNDSFALEPLAQSYVNPDDVLDTGLPGVKVADKYMSGYNELLFCSSHLIK